MAILLARLVQLQLFESATFDREIQKMFEGRPSWLATVRGTISDIKGRSLAVDEPCYRVHMHYEFTRLYDQRFRDFMYLEYETRKKKTHPTEKQIRAYLEEKYGQQQANADKWLSELALVLDVSRQEILSEIKRINDSIFSLRAYMARKNWYKANKLPYQGVQSCDEAVEDLARKIEDPYTRLRQIYRETDPSEIHNYHPILDSISRETAFAIENKFLELYLDNAFLLQPIAIIASKQRSYPYGDAACHLIGQMTPIGGLEVVDANWSQPTDQDLTAYHLGERRGEWGVEYMFESRLRGKRGWKKVNRYLGLVDEPVDQQMGLDVTMTVDIELQKAIENLFSTAGPDGAGCTGAAVVIDVPTGEVRAMVSVPTFDLDKYYNEKNFYLINEIDPDDPNKLKRKPDPLRRKWNRALSWPYQPGSTIKATYLLGALEQGAIGEYDTILCDFSNKNWSGPPERAIHHHGPTDAYESIMKSCNMYYIKLGQRMGYASVKDWLLKSGFGRQILAWPSDAFENRSWRSFKETSGHIAPIGGRLSRKAEIYIYFGLGALDGSILHIANSMATIARDGVYLAPTLIASPKVNRPEIRIASTYNAQIVQKGMAAVIYKPAGTAYKAFNPVSWSPEKLLLYGKTGSTNDSHFSCYARAFDGRTIAIAVMAEIHENGGVIAAPLANKILRQCAKLGYLPRPDLDSAN
ncbi:MAG: hypothetical protein K9M57_04895 [Phycisphaerae bacterium]|nr:hypothetical protein [Phycisphaerae bacterium]